MFPNILRIFVSSPGDVGEERVMTERVVQRLQGEFGQSVKLQPILWEHEPMRATQHPQEQIPLPSECDIVVCLLWSRLGTRLPDQISAAGKTGTEWEFEEAARSFLEKKIPDLLVYRKTKEVVANVDDDRIFEEKKKQRNALNTFLTHWFRSEDGTFKAVFKTFEALDQFEELLEKDLRKLIQERLKLTPLAEKTWHHAPFRGLEVFDFEHAPIFFGRTRAIGAIREALVQQAAHGCAFVMVFGMSGVGKSSLVRAGVLPTITQPGVIEGVGLWRWCVFRPSDATGDLCDGLAAALMAAQALPELAEAGVDARALAKLLREAPDQAALPMSVGLKRAAETTAAAERLLRPPVTHLALVVDQMEELFSSDRVTEPQRIGFVQALSALACSGHVWIIGTMRSDFYPRCAEVPELAALKAGTGQFDLLPPTAPQLAQMIGDPARAAGLRFEEKPTGERLDHVLQETALRDPQALPLLEFTLAELYKLGSKDRPPGESVVLSFAAYDQLGGMEGALARRAEEEFAKLPANVQAALPAVFRALVTVRQGEDEAIVAQPVLREGFAAAADQDAMVEAFIQARLFVSDRSSVEQKAMVRLAHEALLRCWPRLDDWLKANREFLRIRARVSEAAKRWHSEGRLPDLLLPPGKPLTDAESLLTCRPELDRVVVAYVERSQQRAARVRRLRRAAVVAFVLSLVIGTLASSFFAWQSNQNAEAEAKARKKADENADAERAERGKAERATHDALVKKQEADDARADAVHKADDLAKANRKLETALAFTFIGNARREWLAGNVRVAEQLLDSCTPEFRDWEWRYLKRQYHTDLDFPGKGQILGNPLAVSPKGNFLATQFLGDQVMVWRVLPLGDRPLVWSDRYPLGMEAFAARGESSVESLRFSADGRRLAGAWMSFFLSGQDGVKVWDTIAKKTLLDLRGERVNAIALRPDGRQLAVVSLDGAVRIWEVDTAKFVRTLGGPKERLISVAFSPDNKQVAVGTSDGRVQILAAETGKEIFTLTDAGVARHLVFSADGKRLAASDMNQARAWDLGAELKRAVICNGHTELVMGVALSPDGFLLATGSNDRTVKLWDVAHGFLLATYRGHNDLVWSVAFSADGKRLFSGDRTGMIKVWDVTSPQEARRFEGHRSFAHRAAFSPDGKRLASTSDDNTVKIWEAHTGKVLFSFTGHKSATVGVAFSSDGKRVASGSETYGGERREYRGEVLVWDPENGKVHLTLRGNAGRVHALAFSRDGRFLASAGDGSLSGDFLSPKLTPGEVIVWDARDGRKLHTLVGHHDGVPAVTFHPDSKRLVSTDKAGTVRFWNAESGEKILTLEKAGTCLAFSRDGKYLATGGEDRKTRAGTLQVRDANTGTVLFTLKGHAREITAVSFSHDGKRLASASADKTLRLWWNPLNQQEILTLPHREHVRDVVFSPDGDLLASVCWAQVEVWDATPLPVQKKGAPVPP